MLFKIMKQGFAVLKIKNDSVVILIIIISERGMIKCSAITLLSENRFLVQLIILINRKSDRYNFFYAYRFSII